MSVWLHKSLSATIVPINGNYTQLFNVFFINIVGIMLGSSFN